MKGRVFISQHQQNSGTKSVAKQPVHSMGSPEIIFLKHTDVNWYGARAFDPQSLHWRCGANMSKKQNIEDMHTLKILNIKDRLTSFLLMSQNWNNEGSNRRF